MLFNRTVDLLFAVVVFFVVSGNCATAGRHKAEEKKLQTEFDQLVNDLTSQSLKLIKNAALKEGDRIAVTCAYNINLVCSPMARAVANRLSNKLFKQGVKIVERQKVDLLISEQVSQQKLIFDEKNRAEIGKLLGASILGFGTEELIGNKVVMTYRFVSVETGDVISVAEGKIDEQAVVGLFPMTINGIYRLKRVTVKVKEQTGGGEYWDATRGEEEPDLFVTLFIGKNQPFQLQRRNVTRAEWKISEEEPRGLIQYDNRDGVSIKVEDLDLVFHDMIGEIYFEHGFPDSEMSELKVAVPPFGYVELLEIEFSRPNK